MEIHQAAVEFQEEFTANDNVWQIVQLPIGCFYIGRTVNYYYYNDDNMITKQRGGPRVFKSCDAALSVLRQIGQFRFSVCLCANLEED